MALGPPAATTPDGELIDIGQRDRPPMDSLAAERPCTSLTIRGLLAAKPIVFAVLVLTCTGAGPTC